MAKDDRRAKDQAEDGAGLLSLLRQVPTEQFNRMVMKSGLPTAQARKLCREFKRLKDGA